MHTEPSTVYVEIFAVDQFLRISRVSLHLSKKKKNTPTFIGNWSENEARDVFVKPREISWSQLFHNFAK